MLLLVVTASRFGVAAGAKIDRFVDGTPRRGIFSAVGLGVAGNARRAFVAGLSGFGASGGVAAWVLGGGDARTTGGAGAVGGAATTMVRGSLGLRKSAITLTLARTAFRPSITAVSLK